MNSTLKSETARTNGAQSHGPVTEEGKAVSAQNSLRHGLCSKQALLPGEDQQEFDYRRADYIKTFQPRDCSELDLVETMVATRWRLNRLMQIEAHLLTSTDASEDNSGLVKALSLLTRYENQLNRTYDKALQHLQALQQNRPAAQPSAARNEPKTAPKSDADFMLLIENAMRLPVPARETPASPGNGARKDQGAAA